MTESIVWVDEVDPGEAVALAGSKMGRLTELHLAGVEVPKGFAVTVDAYRRHCADSGLDTRKVKLLGTAAWDFPSLGRDDAFVGGWHPSPEPRAWRSFAERFAKTFGNAPPRLASVAYDAVGLAISLSASPVSARFTHANLTRPQGFSGVDGIVRFNKMGLAERGLAVLEVQKFGAAVIDTAPSAFGPAALSTAHRTERLSQSTID